MATDSLTIREDGDSLGNKARLFGRSFLPILRLCSGRISSHPGEGGPNERARRHPRGAARTRPGAGLVVQPAQQGAGGVAMTEPESDEIRHARAVRTLLDLVEGPREERRERQRAVLEKTRAMCLRDFGCLPEWWIELRDEVEAGRL